MFTKSADGGYLTFSSRNPHIDLSKSLIGYPPLNDEERRAANRARQLGLPVEVPAEEWGPGSCPEKVREFARQATLTAVWSERAPLHYKEGGISSYYGEEYMTYSSQILEGPGWYYPLLDDKGSVGPDGRAIKWDEGRYTFTVRGEEGVLFSLTPRRGVERFTHYGRPFANRWGLSDDEAEELTKLFELHMEEGGRLWEAHHTSWEQSRIDRDLAEKSRLAKRFGITL